MPKLPVITGRKAIDIFIKLGYQVARQRGSHIRLLHSDKRPLTVPDHKVLGKGLLRKLIREAEIPVEEFIRLLKK
ncbi:MAG: type II toxin-antitoxin system HicA family toxin [Candidatus Nealsonbacteria bacterium]|nr:type II toxin-antitoxin system HicA family toxin [Candidatus Nealsonbacteria bacterium]